MKNSKKSSEQFLLNPYRIFWGIVVIEKGSLTKVNARKVACAAKATWLNPERDYFVFHAPSHLIDERMQSALNALAVSGVHGKIYKITDKQYGMTKNTWSGEVPECPAPFTHSVVVKDGKCISIFPVSKDQFENALEF